MSTFPCTFEELKRAAVELMRNAPTLECDQIFNGWKALGLMFCGMIPNANPFLGENELVQAKIVLDLTARRLSEISPYWLDA